MKLTPILVFILLGLVGPTEAAAQRQTEVDPTIRLLIQHERQVAQDVVSGDIAALDTVYAADFQFTHGTGLIEGKGEWLSTVERAKASELFRSRLVRDQIGELHGDVAILEGWIDVGADTDYSVHYVRVYQLRDGRWLMVSHRTVEGG